MKKFALILSFVFAFFFTNSTFANTNDLNSLEENKKEKELVASLDRADNLEKLKAIEKADDTIIIIVTDDAVYIVIIR